MKRVNPFESLSTNKLNNEQINTEEAYIAEKATPKKTAIKNDVKNLFTKTEKEKKIIKTIYISETLADKLNQLSKEHNISVNEVIATILEKTLV